MEDLLKEFETYKTRKRQKRFSVEALRAGFKKAWIARDYATIVAVGRKVPKDVFFGNNLLCMWYDCSELRLSRIRR